MNEPVDLETEGGSREPRRTPWSHLGNRLERFLEDEADSLIGSWAIGQGTDAPDRQLFRQLVRLLAAKPPLSVLEVGCGAGIELSGLIHDGLVPQVVTYTGLDFTPEVIEVCRRRFPQVQFDVRNMLAMRDADIADVVLSRAVLEHIQNGLDGLRNLYRAARKLTVISWFMRPSWDETSVGIKVADGFIHHQYSTRDLLSFVKRELAPKLLCRFDFDHYLYPWSVWLLWKEAPPTGLIEAVHSFLMSEAFVASVLSGDRQSGIDDQQARMRELEDAKTWLEQQRSNWEQEAEQRQSVIDNQQAYIAQLENAKIWLEQQRANWEREAERLQSVFEEHEVKNAPAGDV